MGRVEKTAANHLPSSPGVLANQSCERGDRDLDDVAPYASRFVAVWKINDHRAHRSLMVVQAWFPLQLD
jgi:hypothetical protein